MIKIRRIMRLYAGSTLRFILLILICLVLVFPILWACLTSFKPTVEAKAIPPIFIFKPTASNYVNMITSTVWEGPRLIPVFLRNSLFVATCSVLLSGCIAILAAYSVTRFRFKGRLAIAMSILGTRMIPPIGIVTPIFIMVKNLKMLDSTIPLVILYAAFSAPIATWILIGTFSGIPREIDESAIVDGCSRLRVIASIIIPLGAPGIVAATIIGFMGAWNEFTFALFLTRSKAKTLPIFPSNFLGEVGIDWGTMAAACAFIMLPALFVTFAMQKAIVKGLTKGAVKN